jgi:RNA polymerase sigma-70 factor, ECF subfamily
VSILPLHASPTALLDRLRAGDADALAELFARHGERAYATAYRLTCSVDDARDVVQDVWVALPEAAATYEGRGSFEGWLNRIVVRTALLRLRSARRRRETSLPDDDTSPATPSAPRADAPDAVLDRMAIEQALAALPEHLRAVFVLREVEGYTHAEIAELLGLRKGTSEVHLFRARQRLRALLRGSL